MKLAEFEIQEKVYDRLNGSIDCEIYDATPQNETYPYVEIGDPFSVADTGKCNVFVVTVQLHGWDNGRSKKRITNIMSDCVETLTVSQDTTPNFLTLTNFTIHNQLYGGTQYIKDLDNEYWHVITTIEFHILQN